MSDQPELTPQQEKRIAHVDLAEPGKDMTVVQELDPGRVALQVMQQVVRGNITAEAVGVMKEIVGLIEHMEDRNSKKAYNAAFTALQREMPRIEATTPVPNNDGSVRYVFAPYEKIMEQVAPLLVKHGFSVSFGSRHENDRVVAICILKHVQGHEEPREYSVRIGAGPPKATITQADGAALTYAQRGAFCNALNIVIVKDTDARDLGEPITKEQAKSLRERVAATKSNEKAFLQFAGASTYEEISESHFAALDEMLKKKEAKK